PYPLTAEEIDAFTALADQIGLALHSRRLISESREAQSLANQLVQTNRQIALMSQEDELAQALINIMPESVSILSIARFDHPLMPGDTPDYLETRVIVTRTKVTDLRTIDHIHVGATELYTTLDRLREGEIIQIPDIRHYRALLTPNLIVLLQQQGIYHIITLGLRTGNRLLGTMTLGGERTLPTGSQQLDNFRVIADQVAITLDNRLLLNQTAESLDFLQSQYHTANTIHRSEDMVEILSAINQFIGQRYEHGRLGLIDTSVSLSVVHIVAELDHGRSRPANRYVPLNSFPAWDTLAALETLYVQDTADDAFLTPEECDMLTHQGIGAMIIVPLVASQQLLGVIIFNSESPVALDQRYLRAMRNLGDQLAIVLENSTLLHSTAQTLEETQLLYEVTRSILSAQDTLDVLRALRSYLSPEATLINHFTSTTDENRVIRNIVVDYVNSPEDERVVQVPLEQMMGTAGFADFVKALNTDGTTLEIAEDLQADGQSFMLRDFALLNGFRSYIHFIIRERGRVQEMVSINFTTPQVFPESQRRLLRALSDQIGIVLQNHRLLRETQVSAIQLSGQVESMRTLNEIATAVSTLSDQEKLLHITITSLVNLLKVDHGGVVLIDSSGQVGTVSNEYPDHGAIGVKFDIPSHPIFAMMAENNFKPIVINDVDNHPRLNDVSRKSLRDLGVKSVLLLSIAIQGEIIGSLGLDIYTPERTFSQDMVEVAETVTAQVATGLQNMRLLQDTQRRAEQLQHIAAFGQTAQSTLDLYAIFRLGLETSGAILTQDRVRIALYDEEAGKLQVAASRVGNQLDIAPEGGELIPITGYIATVWETRNLLHISDLHAYPRDPQVDARSRDWIVVPMISQGRIIGIVSTGSTIPHVYTQTDVVVFQQFVNQLGAAIDNSRTYMQSQRTAHNEAFINEISTNLQRQRDIQSMLDVTVQQLGKELGARRARIRLTTESNDE
ncbi:MAG: GAF domain-containing protein, partial [Anaerolineae bacterium]|nr:GAF domain-containing protein [Anaerolineae bacterium]